MYFLRGREDQHGTQYGKRQHGKYQELVAVILEDFCQGEDEEGYEFYDSGDNEDDDGLHSPTDPTHDASDFELNGLEEEEEDPMQTYGDTWQLTLNTRKTCCPHHNTPAGRHRGNGGGERWAVCHA